jgi:hypothetical protein
VGDGPRPAALPRHRRAAGGLHRAGRRDGRARHAAAHPARSCRPSISA